MSGKYAFTGIQARITVVFAGLAIALAAVPPAAGEHGARVPARPAGLPPVKGAVGFSALRAAPAEAGAHADGRTGVIVLDSYPVPRGGAQRFAMRLLVRRFHWRRWQFKYLDRLWERESGWDRYASNPYSGAYGIPQALPGSKMSSAGPDWRWSARTQVRWGMRYILGRYRTPYWAWRHEVGYGWY